MDRSLAHRSVPPEISSFGFATVPRTLVEPRRHRAELDLEAFRGHHVRNILAMISANQGFIEKHFDGILDRNDGVDPEDFGVPEADGSGVALAQGQKRINDEIVEKVRAPCARN